MIKERTAREEYLYHNTEKLLKKYRDIVWSIEVETLQAEKDFEEEMEYSIREFLNMPYTAMEDLKGAKVEKQMKTLARNKKMIELIDRSVEVLRHKQGDGELYYWIIYYTYMSNDKCTSAEVAEKIASKMFYISMKTYFAKKKKAIGYLSDILWGFTSKDCLPIIKDLVDER